MTPTVVSDPAATSAESPAPAQARIIESIVRRVAGDPLARWQWVAVGAYVVGLFLTAGAAYTPLAGVGVRATDCAPDSLHAAVQAWLHPEKFLDRTLAAIAPGGDSPYAHCRPVLEQRRALHERLGAGGHAQSRAVSPARHDRASSPQG